jgi:hypothetical protein
MSSNDNEKQGKTLLDSFFDAAEAVVGKAEMAFGEKNGLWKIEDTLDERGTVYRIVNEKEPHKWIETCDHIIAKRVCDALND